MLQERNREREITAWQINLATLTSRETKQLKFNVRYARPPGHDTDSSRRRCDPIKSCPALIRLPTESLFLHQSDQLGASHWLLLRCEVNQRHLSQRLDSSGFCKRHYGSSPNATAKAGTRQNRSASFMRWHGLQPVRACLRGKAQGSA